MSSDYPARNSRIALVGFAVALLAALMVVGAGPVHRFNLVELSFAFALLRWGAWLGLAAVVLALAAAWITRPGGPGRGFVLALAGIVLGGLAFGAPFTMLQAARKVPPIHDITTDTEDPPRFQAILPLRGTAPNSVDYKGAAVAKEQRAAYPDIEPLTLAVAPAAAFQRALNGARDLGWEIVATAPTEGRIEATDTTFWFGFKDDIVVRVTPTAVGSRIDVRSVSRVGVSDLGKNAARVRTYLRQLR